MRKAYVLTGLVLALILVVAGSAQARVWVGAQIGGNFAANTDVENNTPGFNLIFRNVKVEPSVIGGLTIGYDFVREGFLGYNYPDWMKYFSFATDFTFNRFDMREQFGNLTVNGTPDVGFFPGWPIGPTGTRVEGTMAVWSFLFIGKYGFFPDSEVPFGRLQPYVAVGPGIMFSSLRGKMFFPVEEALRDVGDSSVDIALVTEAGVRFMALRNVSLDVSFRYRFGSPSYSFSASGIPMTVKLDANQFNAIFRASYHF